MSFPTSPHQSLIERGSRGGFILDHLHLSAARSEKALGPEGDFRPSHGGQWPEWQVEQSTWGISSVPRPPPSPRQDHNVSHISLETALHIQIGIYRIPVNLCVFRSFLFIQMGCDRPILTLPHFAFCTEWYILELFRRSCCFNFRCLAVFIMKEFRLKEKKSCSGLAQRMQRGLCSAYGLKRQAVC